MHRIDEVGRLDHVVLLVAAQPVLRAERGGEPHVAERRQRVERMHEIARHRGGMGEQADAASGQRLPQRRLGEQAIDAELHGVRGLPLAAPGGSSRSVNASGVVEVRLAGGMAQRPVRARTVAALDDRRQAEPQGRVQVGGRQAVETGNAAIDLELVGLAARR